MGLFVAAFVTMVKQRSCRVDFLSLVNYPQVERDLMAKPKLFVGASLENQAAASALQQELDYDVDVEIWHQGTFQPSEYPLESLEGMLDRADFAAFIIAPDDVTLSRERELSTVRDNVIFEFGLFVGRLGRKRVFLVAPRDVKLDMPSDLINLTPLTFDTSKSNLRAAMGAASTEIRAAIRKAGLIARPTTEVAIQEENEPAAQSSQWFAKVDPSWTLEDYSRNYFFARVFNDQDAASTILKAFEESDPSDEDRAVWDSDNDWTSLVEGQHRPIEAFRSRAAAFPENAALAIRLAAALDHYGNKSLAVQHLTEFADRTDDPEVVARAVERANSLVPLGHDDVVRYRQRLIGEEGQPSSSAVLRALSELARSSGLPLTAKGIDEVRLAQSPDNTDLRFELAYRYGDEGQTALAFLHYHSIPSSQRTGVAWNNLGVAYGNLGMQGNAVAAYEQASSKEETIADANIARKLLSAGFVKEAQIRLQSAVSVPDHHENVVAALGEVQAAQSAEASKKAELLQEAATSQTRELDVGSHALTAPELPFEGNWQTPDTTVEVLHLGNGWYEVKGTYSRKAPHSLGLFATERQEEVQLVYRLRRFGNLLEGTVSRTANGAPVGTGLLGMISNPEQTVTLSLNQANAVELERGRNYEAVWTPLLINISSTMQSPSGKRGG